MDQWPMKDLPLYRSERHITPPWRGGTGLYQFAVNSMLYAASANTWAVVAAANSSILVSSAGGVPSWSTTLPLVTLNAAQTATTQAIKDNSTKVSTTAYVETAVRTSIDPNAPPPASDPTVTDRPHSLANQIYSLGYSAGAQVSMLRHCL